jgi:hypothetical protein
LKALDGVCWRHWGASILKISISAKLATQIRLHKKLSHSEERKWIHRETEVARVPVCAEKTSSGEAVVVATRHMKSRSLMLSMALEMTRGILEAVL